MRATYQANDTVAISGMVVNGWNNVVDNNSGKSIGGQITLTPNKEFSLTTGYLGGPEQDDNTTDWRHLWDTNFTYAASKEVSLAADYVYGQEAQGTKTYKWTGVTGYLQYTPNDMFSITPRFEFFNDHDGLVTGEQENVKAATVTMGFKAKDDLLARVEFRRDWSDHPYFFKNTTEVQAQSTLTVGVVYTFHAK